MFPLILDAAATRACLDYRRLVDALAEAVLERGDGRIACPDRLVVPMADGATMLSMPAVARDLAIHKLVTVAPGNARRSLPVLLGAVTVLEPATGQASLVLDGPTVTGRRTAALSLLAVRVLRPAPIQKALVIGTGAQAHHHADALTVLHPDAALRIRGTSAASGDAFCRAHAAHPGGIAVDAGDNAGDDDADVVFTCTTSRVPVYRLAARCDRLIVAVGAFQPDAAEIAPATVRASTCYVDDPAGARHEAGDLLQAGVDWDGVRSLAEAIRHGGPVSDAPALFKSVGCAAWDLAAARVATNQCGAAARPTGSSRSARK